MSPIEYSPFLVMFLFLSTGEAALAPPGDLKNKLPIQMPPAHEINSNGTIMWRGQQFELDPGVEVVMEVLRNQNLAEQHGHALLTLARVARRLHGHKCLDELEQYYEQANDHDRRSILICFLGARDARVIRMASEALDRQSSIHLRLTAAGALANWNVRRGVAELINFLESNEPLPGGRIPFVRDNALNDILLANKYQGWGFSEDVALGQEGNREYDRTTLMIVELRKWWAENQNRFPDWKLGDPLPTIDATDNKVESAPAEPK